MTPLPTATVVPTATEVPAELLQEVVAVGQTGFGNSIVMEVLLPAGGLADPPLVVLLIGGIHPQEHTGWKQEGGGAGWLTLLRQWLVDHPQQWEGLAVALVDVNPDGVGRHTPGGVDLQRNFGGEECPICAWRQTDPQSRSLCDPDGPAPNSEPEAQALLNAAQMAQRWGEVAFFIVLHNQVPPRGLVDAAYCGRGGNPMSCTIAADLARQAGADYITRWELYGCEGEIPEGLAGQPPDYLSYVYDLAGADYEFPARIPDAGMAERFMRATLLAVRTAYGRR